ncbi:MAG: aromatic ring-hydroxylating dioxygenase subunit alpha [Burkholderiaceae bacterium]
MTKPMSDEAVMQRVFAHVDAKSTDLGDEVWREPVHNYRSPGRFARETELMRHMPTVFCPSAMLPEPGSYFARTHAGMPLLAVRGEDRIVRVFHNACRHRGMMLAEGQGRVRGGFVCRYHAWAYGLDGGLKRVAGGLEGFPGLDPAEHGLTPVRAEERAGLVFVTPAERVSDGALAALPEIITGDQRLFDYDSFVDDANWKLLKEFSMEGYHIKSLHHETFYPYGYDNLNVIETFGPNSRITFPFKRIEKLRELSPGSRSIVGRVTYVTQIFPNARISILSNHYQMVILEPIDPSHTRWHVFRLTLPGETHDDESLARAKRDAGFVKDTGLLEDREAALSSQRALAGDGNSHFTFGLYEKAAVHFHRMLDGHLETLDARERGLEGGPVAGPAAAS